MVSPSRSVLNRVESFLRRLRFRTLFIVAATLFAVDLVVPDFIPLIDEVLLLIATIVLSRWRQPEDVDVIDITPKRKS
jgi:hypothetical protein